MHYYDCVVIGNTEAALFSAAYLSRAHKKVALVLNAKKTTLETSVKRFKDDRGKAFHYGGLHYPLGGLDYKGLLAAYLQKIGIDEALPVIAATASRIVTKQGRVLTQDRGMKAFKVYLIRHFPTQRQAIERFFDTVLRHYRSYKQERQNRLLKRPYVIDSLRAEWGNLSLDEVLKDYFDHPDIRKVFTLLYGWQTLPQTHISAHSYFVYFFNHFMEPIHYLDAPMHTLQKKVLASNPSLEIIRMSIKQCEWKKNTLESLTLEEGTLVKANAYYFHMNPNDLLTLCDQADHTQIQAKISPYFDRKQSASTMFTYYVGLDTPTDNNGLDAIETVYEADGFSHEDATLYSTLDYSAVYTKAASASSAALIVQATSQKALDKEGLCALLKQVNKALPKQVTLVKTVAKEATTGTYNAFLAAQQSLKAKTFLEAFGYRRVFDNAYFLDEDTTFEMGFAGRVITAIDLADNVLQYLENETAFVRVLKPAPLINAFAYPLSVLPKNHGKRLKVTIVNRTYVLVFTSGRPTIFQGQDDYADATIEIDEKTLYDWLFTERKITDINHTPSCRMQGDTTLLQSVIDVLAQTRGQSSEKTHKKPKVSGTALMIGALSLFMVYIIAAFYSHPAIVFTIASLLQGVYVGWYKKQFRRATTWDSFALLIYPLYALLYWLFGDAAWLGLEWIVLIGGLFWILNSFIRNPLPHGWYINDYPNGYAHSPYFVTLMSGLGIIIGISLLAVFISLRWLDGGDQFIGVFAIVVALYLAVDYPKRYENAMIKIRK